MRKLAGLQKGSAVCDKFAQIGTGGKFKTNLYRDLLVKLKALGGVEPTMVRVPVKNRRTKKIVYRLWPIVAPHELLHCLLKQGVLHELLLGADDDLIDFWEHFMREPDFGKLKQVFDRSVWGVLFPLRLHGDEGKFHNKGVMIFTLAGIRHHHDPFLTRLLLTVMPQTRYVYSWKKVPGFKIKQRKPKMRRMKINVTLAAISDFIAQSLQCLVDGKFPQEPFNGTLMTALGKCMRGQSLDLFGALLGVKGDWKFEKEFFQEPRGWSSKNICTCCDASKTSETPYQDNV